MGVPFCSLCKRKGGARTVSDCASCSCVRGAEDVQKVGVPFRVPCTNEGEGPLCVPFMCPVGNFCSCRSGGKRQKGGGGRRQCGMQERVVVKNTGAGLPAGQLSDGNSNLDPWEPGT